MRKPTWKKDASLKAAKAIAADIAQAFNVPEPAVECPEYLSPREWEWRIETLQVWTKAGAAELNVTIDAGFAHLYFRFDDPARAIPFDDAVGRLNRHSGKWNYLDTPRNGIGFFVAALRRDFALVAEPHPDPAEVEERAKRKAIEAEEWAKMRAEFAAECAKREAAKAAI